MFKYLYHLNVTIINSLNVYKKELTLLIRKVALFYVFTSLVNVCLEITDAALCFCRYVGKVYIL